MVFLPNISRPTVPLGVDVPSDRVDDPVVRAAIKQFRLWCLGLGAAVFVGLIVTRDRPTLSTLWVLLYLFGAMGVYALCRRPIMRAKAEQGWYDGVQVRVSASVTAKAEQPVRVLWPVHLLSLTLAVGPS